MLAQHFAGCIHFNTNLFAVLLSHGFEVGALFFPTDDCSAFCLRLGSLLHRGRHIRTVDSLFLVFFFLRLSSHAKCQGEPDKRAHSGFVGTDQLPDLGFKRILRRVNGTDRLSERLLLELLLSSQAEFNQLFNVGPRMKPQILKSGKNSNRFFQLTAVTSIMFLRLITSLYRFTSSSK